MNWDLPTIKIPVVDPINGYARKYDNNELVPTVAQYNTYERITIKLRRSFYIVPNLMPTYMKEYLAKEMLEENDINIYSIKYLREEWGYNYFLTYMNVDHIERFKAIGEKI